MADFRSIVLFPRVFILGHAAVALENHTYDFYSVATNWHKQTAATWSDGDFNADGLVDDHDAAILARHWMMTVEDMDDDDERDAVFAMVGSDGDALGLLDE